MSRTTRTVVAGGVMAVLLMAAGQVDATDRQPPATLDVPVTPADPRVRTEDPVLAALIRDSTDRSTSFRRMVEAIQATDGVVYIERGRCNFYVRTCLAFGIAVVGPNRMLRVIVDKRKAGFETAASVAHELQHALEVLEHRSVTTPAAVRGLFERIGTWDGNSFETSAAVKVGLDVRAELQKQSAGCR